MLPEEGRSILVADSTATLEGNKPALRADMAGPGMAYRPVYKCKAGKACKVLAVDNTADSSVVVAGTSSGNNRYRMVLSCVLCMSRRRVLPVSGSSETLPSTLSATTRPSVFTSMSAV
ncbi:unnamed protein product, partial [Iphiclides podalirius]